MTADIRPFRPVEEPTLEAVCAAYPRQIGMHYLVRAYHSGMIPIPLSELLAAFKRYAAYCRGQEQFMMSIRRYIEDRCWNDVYELPKAPVQSPQEAKGAMRKLMERKAAEGCRFSQDWLKRNT